MKISKNQLYLSVEIVSYKLKSCIQTFCRNKMLLKYEE